jgi:hypothetical protein
MNEANGQYGKNRLQVRCEFDMNRIHIQGVGPTQVNRKYGLALELQAPPALTSWLQEQEPTTVSPASGNLLYIEAEMRHYFEDGDKTQLVILGESLNHPQGAALEMDMNDDNLAVQTLIQFTKESGLLVLTTGNAHTVESEEE